MTMCLQEHQFEDVSSVRCNYDLGYLRCRPCLQLLANCTGEMDCVAILLGESRSTSITGVMRRMEMISFAV